LICSPRDRVRHHSIEPEAGKQHCKQAKEARQRREEMLLCKRLLGLAPLSFYVEQRNVPVDFADSLADRPYKRGGIAARAHFEVHLSERRRLLSVREVNRGRCFVTQAGVLRV